MFIETVPVRQPDIDQRIGDRRSLAVDQVKRNEQRIAINAWTSNDAAERCKRTFRSIEGAQRTRRKSVTVAVRVVIDDHRQTRGVRQQNQFLVDLVRRLPHTSSYFARCQQLFWTYFSPSSVGRPAERPVGNECVR